MEGPATEWADHQPGVQVSEISAGRVGQDPWDLERYITAQNSGDGFGQVQRELALGLKTSHWIWYVFPQMHGLGTSREAVKFGITGRAEAEAYLAHPVLGRRLIAASEALLAVEGRTAVQILGTTDTMKLKSSAKLFASVSPPGSVFHLILAKYCDGVQDDVTLRKLMIAD